MAKHKSFKSFALAIKKNAEEIKEKSEKKIVSAVLSGYNTAIVVTPVDEGRARNNWQMQNKLDVNSIQENGKLKQASKFSNPIYLVNNLPYIKRLDEGWSGQRPEGMTIHIKESIVSTLRRK